MNSLRSFLIALQFLTRIPVTDVKNSSEKDVGQSILFYPLVGLIIGVLLFSLAMISSGTSSFLSATLILAFWVIITGGLHIDGLADSADAWVGGNGNKQRSLEIMKDPRSGPIAIVLVVLVLLLKLAALQLVIQSEHFALLIIAPIIGRMFMPLLFMTTTYVRNNGLGSSISEHLPSTIKISVVAILCSVFILSFGLIGLTSLIVSSFSFYVIRRTMIRRIDGVTGDTAGATLEIIETMALLTIALLIQN